MDMYNPLDAEKREFNILRVNTSGCDVMSQTAYDAVWNMCQWKKAQCLPSYKAIYPGAGVMTHFDNEYEDESLNQRPVCQHTYQSPLRGLYAIYVVVTDMMWLVWLDAVCINQQDSSERGKQVAAMMLDFYSRAAAVLFWSG